MSDFPAGYREPPMESDIELSAIEWAIEFVIQHKVKFRYEGEKNTMLWWIPDTDHQGTEISSLVRFIHKNEIAS